MHGYVTALLLQETSEGLYKLSLSSSLWKAVRYKLIKHKLLSFCLQPGPKLALLYLVYLVTMYNKSPGRDFSVVLHLPIDACILSVYTKPTRL